MQLSQRLPQLASALKEAIRGHLASLNLSDCVGVSLTMKQADGEVALDEIRASQNMRHFLNCLNSAIFGKRFKRFGKRLNVVPVFERSSSHRLHYHLILQNPFPDKPAYFRGLVEKEWVKTYFGYPQFHIDDQIDHGWGEYITKFKSASDGIDWENYHWI